MHIKDKKDTNTFIGKLQAENDFYKMKLGSCSCDSGQGMPVHSITSSELAQQLGPLMKALLKNFEKLQVNTVFYHNSLLQLHPCQFEASFAWISRPNRKLWQM